MNAITAQSIALEFVTALLNRSDGETMWRLAREIETGEALSPAVDIDGSEEAMDAAFAAHGLPKPSEHEWFAAGPDEMTAVWNDVIARSCKVVVSLFGSKPADAA